MNKGRTLHSENAAARFGPVYEDEFRSLEVRSLNATEKELWTALAFRTRSAKGGPETATGLNVRYSDLAYDIGKICPKTKRVKPVSKKTVQRAMQGLVRRGLVSLTLQYRRHPRVVMLRPPSICGKCAAGKSCLHKRSPVDWDFLEQIGVTVKKLSTGLSTGGKPLSSLSGQPGCPPRVDSQGVHTGSDPIQNSYSNSDEKNYGERIRKAQAIAMMRTQIENKGIALSDDATDQEIKNSWIQLYTQPSP